MTRAEQWKQIREPLEHTLALLDQAIGFAKAIHGEVGGHRYRISGEGNGKDLYHYRRLIANKLLETVICELEGSDPVLWKLANG